MDINKRSRIIARLEHEITEKQAAIDAAGCPQTPSQKTIQTRRRNSMRQKMRQVACLRANQPLSKWMDFSVDDYTL